MSIYSFIQTLVGIASFYIMWTLSVALFLFAGYEVWSLCFEYGSGLWNPLTYYWNNQLDLGQYLELGPVPNVPDWEYIKNISLNSGFILLIATIITNWMTSMRSTIRTLGECTKLDDQHPITMTIHSLAKKANVKPPSIWIMPSNQVNAFALSKPGRRSIILTTGILEIPVDELRWIIGHELGHIKCGDSFSAAFWIGTVKIEVWIRLLQYYFTRIIFPIIRALPFLRIFSFPLELSFIVLWKISTWSSGSAKWLFKTINFFIQRKMEYKADKFACKIMPPEIGVKALYRIGGFIEPSFSFFASHPPMEKRIKKLRSIKLSPEKVI